MKKKTSKGRKPRGKPKTPPKVTRSEQKAAQQALALRAAHDEAVKDKNELFHDTDDVPWARLALQNHYENLPLRGVKFRHFLTRILREQSGGMMPSKRFINDALNQLEGNAIFDGPLRQVELRVAEHNGNFYIDMCDADWHVIRINAGGWQVLKDAPVRFRRAEGMRALPMPEQGGNVYDLFKVINIPHREDQILILSWLTSALRPSGPYPLCVMYGQQGSAKTTTQTFLRRLVDPSEAPLRSTPRDERDLIISAKHSHVLAFDNLSSVSPGLSDALCRLATGAAFSTRKLYTDDRQMIFSGQRPVMFNGIEHIADRGDLLDRMLLFRLPKIEGAERLTASNLNQQFHRIEGRIFGALLDAVAVSMREYPNVKLDKPPRMADFAIHSIAASSALGFTQAEFTEAYENNRSELRHVAIEGSVTAVEVIEWFNRVNVMTGTVKREWQGTHKELLGELGRREGLPRTARGLQAELARVEPNLIAAGVVLTRLQRESGTGRRPIKLTRTVEHQSVVDVAAIQAQEQREAQARAASDAAEAERQRAWAEKDKLREERKAERLAHCKRWLTEFLTEPKKKHATLNAGKTAPFYFDKTELERARTELSLGEELRPDGKYWLPLGSEPKSEVHFFTGTSAIH